MMGAGSNDEDLPRARPGFESVRRYRNTDGRIIVKLLPGDCYVTSHDEVLDTVLGSRHEDIVAREQTYLQGLETALVAGAIDPF